MRRLAMLGFIAAISAEFASHKGLLQQYRMAPGPIAVVFLLFTVASLIPISKVRPSVLFATIAACVGNQSVAKAANSI